MSEMRNPGALAGATGADHEGINFKTERYRRRALAATALCHAIGECHPEDAVLLMQAALADLSPAYPLPVLSCPVQEARLWASIATDPERKAWAIASIEALAPAARRQVFLAVARTS